MKISLNNLYLVAFILLELISFQCVGQKKITNYLLENKCYSYEHTRRYLSDSVFIETYHNKRIGTEMVMDTFKLSGDKWYYCLDGQYEILFSKEMFEQKIISRQYFRRITDSAFLLFRESHIAYEPLYTTIYNGRKVYVYYYYVWGSRSALKNDYPDLVFFDPEYGIVKKQEEECGVSEMKIIK